MHATTAPRDPHELRQVLEERIRDGRPGPGPSVLLLGPLLHARRRLAE